LNPRGILGRELAELTSRRLALAVKLAYPLVVGVPLILSAAPAFYAAMALTMLVALLGGLGSAAVLARERASGLQLRYRLLPEPAPSQVMKRVAAGAIIDLLQVVPLLGLIALRHPDRVAWLPSVLITLVGTLLAVDALGALASSLADSPGEVMLYVLIPLLPSFYLSGLFIPMSGLLAGIALLLPFSHLHAALLGALGGNPVETVGWTLVGGGAWAAAGMALAAAAGNRVLEAE
jgi:ABC-2 type transport system permease protein